MCQWGYAGPGAPYWPAPGTDWPGGSCHLSTLIAATSAQYLEKGFWRGCHEVLLQNYDALWYCESVKHC